MHHLCENKEVLEVVGYFFSDELDKVRDELVKTWICAEAGESSDAILFV